MSKYYYTDPLKAAWMSQAFDAKYLVARIAVRGGDDAIVAVHLPLSISELLSNIDNKKDDNYLLHPDCHEMLKPQVGDLLKIGHETWAVCHILNGKRYIYSDYGDIEDEAQINAYPIIQRNGNAFFMPEVG